MAPQVVAPVTEWLAEAQRLVTERGSESLYHVVLDVAVRRLGAAGGAVWCAANGRLDVVTQVGVGGQPIDDMQQRWPGHGALLERVRQNGRPQIAKARLDRLPSGNHPEHNASTPIFLAVVPIRREERDGPRILELFLTARGAAAAADETLGALNEFCVGVAGIRLPTGAPSDAVAGDLAGFSQFCTVVHASLDVDATAAAIVSQVRAWMHCSRVSLLRRRGRRCRLLAVSDLEDFDRRSEAVRSLERLAAQVVQDGRTHLQEGRSGPGAAASSTQEQFPRDEGRPWLLAVVPLPPPAQEPLWATGVLIVEDFDEAAVWNDERRTRLQLAAVQAGAALQNALGHEGVPLHRLGRLLQRLGWRSAGTRIVKYLACTTLLGALVAAMVLVETDFDISGGGTLRPATERDVFAGIDGIVDDVRALHGDAVAANDVLVQLRSPRLAQERAELEGQRRTTEQQIADLAALRGGREPRSEGRPLSQAELAARQEELHSVLESLDGQLAALARHEQELIVRSPIAGRVLTWNVEQLLQGRPILAGQRLLSVADVAGPWIAEVRVPDRDIAHVQAAQRDGQPLRVSLVAATDLNTRRVGAVTDIARVVTHDPLEGPVVVVTVAVEPQPGFDARPGATVYPRIHCGRRSLGYVWFRRLYETVASWAAL